MPAASNFDFHVALLFGPHNSLALVAESAAGKACYLQQVSEFMVTLNPAIRRALSAKLISSPGSRLVIF